MPFIPFTFRKVNAPTIRAYYDGLPSWEYLASEMAKLFHIPQDRIGVAFVDKVNGAVTLTNTDGLQTFYESLDQSPEEIKFVVQDLEHPDGESASS